MTASRCGLSARRSSPRFALLLALSVLTFAEGVLADADAVETPQAPSSMVVPDRLRLLVIATHPDDEILGAAGLMQRVEKLHGRVSVAYLTSGDGYLDGVELETGKLKPRPKDYVDYGERRLHEALRALRSISIDQKSLFVFGFPDGGLLDLLTRHWSSRNPFVSPYTHDSHPPYPSSLDPAIAYSGVALERELARLITHVNPRWIAVSAPWDIHPDHCAAFHFVVRALRRLSASNPTFVAPQLLAYTVHRPDWPGFGEGTVLGAPPDVSPTDATWQFLYLSAEELEGKGRALDHYTTQMDIMAVLFRAFVRPNEVFAVYSSLPVLPPDACGRPLPVPVESHSTSR
jgi:LmbE family N-acetylglucosaminyl deacetylase